MKSKYNTEDFTRENYRKLIKLAKLTNKNTYKQQKLSFTKFWALIRFEGEKNDICKHPKFIYVLPEKAVSSICSKTIRTPKRRST